MTTEKQRATNTGSRTAGAYLVRVMRRATLVCLLLAGCSKNDSETTPAPTDGVIRINAQIASSSQSKGIILNSQALNGVMLLRAEAASGYVHGYSGSVPITANRTASGALTDFSTPQLYPVNNKNVFYKVFYPAGTSVTKRTTWAIEDGGKTDLLANEGSWSAGSYTNLPSTVLVLEHQLARLQVVCKADPAAAESLVQEHWGQITKIEILETATEAAIDYADVPVKIKFAGSAALKLSAADCETAFSNVTLAAATSTPCAGGMFAPDLTGTLPLKLKVYTATTPEGEEVSVQLKQSSTAKGFAKGMTHTVTLTFGIVAKNIAVSATSVDAWVTGGTGSGDDITSSNRAPMVEDYYYTDGTWSRELNSAKTVEGVICWIDPAFPNHFKIVSMDVPPANWGGTGNSVGKLKWCSTEQVDTDATSHTDGKANTLTLVKRSNVSLYHAAAWCYKKNPGLSYPASESATTSDAGYNWYLPAKEELQHLLCASWGIAPMNWMQTMPTTAAGAGYPAAWNARFTTTFASDIYWSSTENSNAEVWPVNFNGGFADIELKNNQYNVRCMREINPPPAPAVEDYYYTDGTYSRELNSSKTVEGVVFWVDATNPKHFKIVAMDEPPANWDGGTNTAGCLPWSTEQVTTNATSASDGKQNTLMLMMRDNAPTAYPAAKWCYTRNTGLSIPAASSAATSDANYKWYLPAKDELQHLFCAYRGAAPTTWADDASGAPAAAAGYPAAWNARFTGKTSFAFAYYWASTEYRNSTSWSVSFSNGHTFNNGGKTGPSYRARCVMEITNY